MKPKVYNKHHKDAPQGAVYVGRPSPYGNPWGMGDLTREQVVAKYSTWISLQPEMLKNIVRDLKGKDLVCWCAPQACHADILLEIANKDDSKT